MKPSETRASLTALVKALLLSLLLTGCAAKEELVPEAPVSEARTDLPTVTEPAAAIDPEPPPPPSEPLTRVRTASGFVEGALLPREANTAAERKNSQAAPVAVFRGIPYAQPPVAELRFRPPKPAKRWQGSKLTREFAPPCISSFGLPSEAEATVGAEDCLYLNVWTAARSTEERRPVMVVFASADSDTGDAGHWIYDGQEMARRGAVVVSFNYRSGVLGFLAHPALSTEQRREERNNDGLAGGARSWQLRAARPIAALRWTRLNIAASRW